MWLGHPSLTASYAESAAPAEGSARPGPTVSGAWTTGSYSLRRREESNPEGDTERADPLPSSLRAALDELARVPTSFILPLAGRAPADAPAVASDLSVSPRQLLELGVVARIVGNAPVDEPSPAPTRCDRATVAASPRTVRR
jgi:hypothetical protein